MLEFGEKTEHVSRQNQIAGKVFGPSLGIALLIEMDGDVLQAHGVKYGAARRMFEKDARPTARQWVARVWLGLVCREVPGFEGGELRRISERGDGVDFFFWSSQHWEVSHKELNPPFRKTKKGTQADDDSGFNHPDDGEQDAGQWCALVKTPRAVSRKSRFMVV